MKVVHIITGLRIGGAETQLRLLLRHSRAQSVVIALTNADEVADAIRGDGVTVHSLDMKSNVEMGAVRRLARLIASERPDVVHLHLYRATLYGRVAARLAHVPVVVTTEHSLLEGLLEGRQTTRGVKWLYRATEPMNTATIAVSHEVARRLIGWGVPASKIWVIPNGVDLDILGQVRHQREAARRQLHIPADSQVIGGIGRLSRTKRWDLLLRAVAPILGPRLQLQLLGAGQEEATLRALASSLQIEPWVKFAGARSDLAALLPAFDVVASPAPQETFGLALLEAVAAGRPVVYVHSPSLDDIRPMQGVVQVPAEEAPMREAILNALREPSGGQLSPALIRYDIRGIAAQVDLVYQTCLQQKRKK